MTIGEPAPPVAAALQDGLAAYRLAIMQLLAGIDEPFPFDTPPPAAAHLPHALPGVPLA